MHHYMITFKTQGTGESTEGNLDVALEKPWGPGTTGAITKKLAEDLLLSNPPVITFAMATVDNNPSYGDRFFSPDLMGNPDSGVGNA